MGQIRETLRGALTLIVLLGLAAAVAACADEEFVPTPIGSAPLATVAPPSVGPSAAESAIASLGPPPDSASPAGTAGAASAGIPTLAPPSGGSSSAAPSSSLPVTSQAPTALPTPSTPPIPTPTLVPTIANGIDPCRLLTSLELEEIVGHPLLDTTTLGSPTRPVGCRWEFRSGQAATNWELSLGVTSPGGRKAFDDARVFKANGTPLPTLGDGAFSVIGNTIFAVKGDTMIDVQYLAGADEPNRQTVPVEILRLALQRVP